MIYVNTNYQLKVILKEKENNKYYLLPKKSIV